jgi:hypothetical protein
LVSQLKVNEIIKQSGSSITIGEDGDTVSGPFTNTPAFKVDMASNQTLSSGTWTKMNLDNEGYDTDSAFDTSNYRFTVPSGKGGKYQFHTSAFIDSMSTSLLNYIYIAYYVNGSRNRNINHHNFTNSDIRSFTMTCSMQVDLSAGDYLEAYVMVNIEFKPTFTGINGLQSKTAAAFGTSGS